MTWPGLELISSVRMLREAEDAEVIVVARSLAEIVRADMKLLGFSPNFTDAVGLRLAS